MEHGEVERALRAVSSSLSELQWRLKPSSKRRLDTDILALCAGMRPVVMVDYGGKMPELQERLCSFVNLIQKEESAIFEQLRVMVIGDMIYLLNVREFAEYIRWSLSSEAKLLFLDLEKDPPTMLREPSKSIVAMQLVSIQKVFSSIFTIDGVKHDVLKCYRKDNGDNAKPSILESENSQVSELIDVSICMKDTPVTIPTLNGWLLGYPVVYLFDKDHISDAIYNLSTKFLHLFKIVVCRNVGHANESQSDELMSFSVPYVLSVEGRSEPWAEVFLLHMQGKWERCREVWRSLQMEVDEWHPQAVVL